MAKKNFLKEIEKAIGGKPRDLYKSLGWSRQRYFYQRESGSFPSEHLPAVRKAVGWGKVKYYKFVGEFLESKG